MQQRPIELVARTGYAARGIVHILIGALALVAAFGGGKAVGAKGALAELLEHPFGSVLLGIIAIGFLCFAGWRFMQALLDADRLGTGRKALLRRAGRLIGGIITVGLAGSAISLMRGAGSGDDDGSARDWTATLLSAPFGQWLVGSIGFGIVAAGFAFMRRGWTESFADDLALDGRTRAWTVPLGRYGYIARGVLFVMVGGFLVLAALHASAREAKGIAGALRILLQQTQRVGTGA